MKKQRGSSHIIVIVGLIVAIAALLGYVFWKNNTTKEPVSSTPEASDDATKNSGKTNAGTKTYKKENAYSFEYPKTGWTAAKSDFGDVEVTSDDYQAYGMGVKAGAIVGVYASQDPADLDQVYAKYEEDKATFGIKDLKRETIGANDAVTYHSAYEGVRYHTVVVHDGSTYDIVYRFADEGNTADHMDAYDQIRSTFTFL